MHDLVSHGTICVHCMQVASIGWSSVFYIFGSLGVLWFAFWVQNASSSPVGDSLVSETEAEYIIENTCDQVCHCRHVDPTLFLMHDVVSPLRSCIVLAT
jgi:hypothetical protein